MTNLKQALIARAADKTAVYLYPAPNPQRNASKSEACRQAWLATAHAMRERPEGIRASHESWNSSGGCSRCVLNYALAGKGNKAEVAEVGNEEVATTKSGPNLKVLANEKIGAFFGGDTCEVMGGLVSLHNIARRKGSIVNISTDDIRRSGVKRGAHFEELFNVLFHIFSPAPRPEARSQHDVVGRSYPIKRDRSTYIFHTLKQLKVGVK